MDRQEFEQFALQCNDYIKEEGIEPLWINGFNEGWDIIKQSEFICYLYKELESCQDIPTKFILFQDKLFIELDLQIGAFSLQTIENINIIASVCSISEEKNKQNILFCLFYKTKNYIKYLFHTITDKVNNSFLSEIIDYDIYGYFAFLKREVNFIWNGKSSYLINKLEGSLLPDLLTDDNLGYLGFGEHDGMGMFYEDFLTNLNHFKHSGIYIVYTIENIVYVGQSKDICSRWRNGHHRKNEIDFVNLIAQCYVLVIEVTKEDKLLLNERRLIDILKPKLNDTKITIGLNDPVPPVYSLQPNFN